jgi:hypothetical protein
MSSAGSVRTRVAILALLVVVLLIGCGFAFFLILQNRESAVTADTQRHLASLAVRLARDYTSHQSFQKEKKETSPLENPEAAGSDDVLSLMNHLGAQERSGH